MSKFFRKIRQQLVEQAQIRNYLLYAAGEILLVVVGILIALQVNDWNERRKQEQQFKATLEQLYTSITEDAEVIYTFQVEQNKQIDWINRILTDPRRWNPHQLLHVLSYIETRPYAFRTETDYHLSFLKADPDDVEQKELAEKIYTAVKNNIFDIETFTLPKEVLTPLLAEAGITVKPMIFSWSALDSFEQVDTAYFSEEDVEALKTLLTTKQLADALKALRETKSLVNGPVFTNYLEDNRSVLASIQAYYPEARLLFEDVGIVGSALSTGWDKSVPLTLTDPQAGTWQGDISLKDGEVKFRTRNSWKQNWGGKDFPAGRTLMFGTNIPVREGHYRVVLNLSENRYEFIRQKTPIAKTLKK